MRRPPAQTPDPAEWPRASGRTFGTAAEVAWITSATTVDRTITSAIPPVFAAYATIVEASDDYDPNGWSDRQLARQERALVRHLLEHGSRRWWLGYLDTGVHDVVFPEAARVELYAHWSYVLVLGGPAEATTWRDRLPDLIFPTDHTWLVSMLWDDDWTCVGGPAHLVEALVADPDVDLGGGARVVRPGVDATPPGHVSF